MKIIISTESTCDLSKELLAENDIRLLPFHITTNDGSFLDGQVSTEELFELTDKTGVLPKTNAINQFEYEEYFTALKKEADAIIHISLSSGLSSSFNNALNASKQFENVFVIDSLNLSTGIGLLVLYACDLVKQDKAPQEIADLLNARRDKVQASFVLHRLDYLYKGGRCNALSYFGANLFKIRPRIVVKDGKMSSDKKYKGSMGKVVAKYGQGVLEEFNKPDLERVFITYTTATPEMLEEARMAVQSAGFRNVYETRAGCTIASHCGANTLGILYFNDGVNEEFLTKNAQSVQFKEKA